MLKQIRLPLLFAPLLLVVGEIGLQLFHAAKAWTFSSVVYPVLS
jgi:hypothetical protein